MVADDINVIVVLISVFTQSFTCVWVHVLIAWFGAASVIRRLAIERLVSS